MSQLLRRFARALADLPAESRPAFNHIDASPARQDNGSWLRPLV